MSSKLIKLTVSSITVTVVEAKLPLEYGLEMSTVVLQMGNEKVSSKAVSGSEPKWNETLTIYNVDNVSDL